MQAARGLFNTLVKPGGAPVPPPGPGPAPGPPLKCPKTGGVVSHECLYDPQHAIRNWQVEDAAACCAACEAEAACTSWTAQAGFGATACTLFNRTQGAPRSGELRAGNCQSSGGVLPPSAPRMSAGAAPPAAGPPCKDCPNILLMFTDDQDLVLGGWGLGSSRADCEVHHKTHQSPATSVGRHAMGSYARRPQHWECSMCLRVLRAF